MATKKTLVSKIHFGTGLSRVTVETVLDAFAFEVYRSLISEGVAVLPHLGRFKTTTSKTRKGRNPRTGESLIIPEKQRVKFSPGVSLKTLL